MLIQNKKMSQKRNSNKKLPDSIVTKFKSGPIKQTVEREYIDRVMSDDGFLSYPDLTPERVQLRNGVSIEQPERFGDGLVLKRGDEKLEFGEEMEFDFDKGFVKLSGQDESISIHSDGRVFVQSRDEEFMITDGKVVGASDGELVFGKVAVDGHLRLCEAESDFSQAEWSQDLPVPMTWLIS